MKRCVASYCAQVAVFVVALFCIDASATDRPVESPATAVLLSQADQIYSSDQHRFLRILKQLHEQAGQLTPAQHWHLKLLDALRWVFAAQNAKASPLLRDIIEHSGDPALSARATALLIQVEFLRRHYDRAYELTGALIADLPGVTDPAARLLALSEIIQMMNSVGQFDLALKYAREIKATFPSAKGQCQGGLYEAQTLAYAGKLDSGSHEYADAIDACLVSHQAIFANALRLDIASQLIADGQPQRAIALLHRIAPSIRESGYQFHIAQLPVTLAMAYARQGDDADARKYALTALTLVSPGSYSYVVQQADKVLYEVAKRAGHDAAALAYFEKYVALDKESADGAKMQALAYQEVKQEVSAKKLRLATLGKQNRILQLRQALARQAQKTSRLLIALLLVVIGFISLAALWLWRSQLRFRRMARHDGLTGTYNREHFFSSATRVLRRLHREGAAACLIVLDLDHFKRVNDMHGHAVGDEVLRRTVLVIRRQLGDSDLLGRLGGEEFGILLPACPHERGTSVADRIRRALAATPMVIDDQVTLRVSASFGMACSARSAHTLRQLLIEADAALYRAKDGGRNQVVTEACDEATEDQPTEGERATLTV
ncbi:diguanylate cyclase [Dyella sp. A6]|uniref:sensor domain-containing diguanylate cyclase n=1 Tax=Dyella aluminiiresistens TaxID=3069105 RepID=UPI002E77967E|nr:diguanylate cyclase [Dyella sp. A6]